MTVSMRGRKKDFIDYGYLLYAPNKAKGNSNLRTQGVLSGYPRYWYLFPIAKYDTWRIILKIGEKISKDKL